MKGNEISVKELRADAIACLTKLQQILLVQEYGKGTVRNYCQEMQLSVQVLQPQSGGRHPANEY
ncbi:hypothetical protein MASR1M65_19410 [Saprospiraceae bacterium]